jgi:hypothetical protein
VIQHGTKIAVLNSLQRSSRSYLETAFYRCVLTKQFQATLQMRMMHSSRAAWR